MNSMNRRAATPRPRATHRSRLRLVILLLVPATLLAFGCANKMGQSIVGPGREPKLVFQAATLRQVYSDQLADLLGSGTDLADEGAVLDRTLLFYEVQFGAESRDYSLLRDAVQQRRAGTGASNLVLAGAPLQRLVTRVTARADQAQTYAEFQSALE